MSRLRAILLRAPCTVAITLLALGLAPLPLPPGAWATPTKAGPGNGSGPLLDLIFSSPLSQLFHATPRHLAVDVLAFALLGLSFERQLTTRRWAFWTCLAGAFAWLAWLALYPRQSTLLGLSAVNHALLAAGLVSLTPRWRPGAGLLALVVAHAAWETFLSAPPFRLVDIDDAPGVSRVSAVHLASVGFGIVLGMGRLAPSSRNQPPCSRDQPAYAGARVRRRTPPLPAMTCPARPAGGSRPPLSEEDRPCKPLPSPGSVSSARSRCSPRCSSRPPPRAPRGARSPPSRWPRRASTTWTSRSSRRRQA